MKGWSRLFGLALITGLTSSSSLAITPLTGTRIVYDLSTDSAALLIQNNSPNHININTWITDNDNRTIDNFNIHVSNIGMSSQTKSKITLQAKDKKLFSQKQESLYWLNIAENDKNQYRITRLKIFTRPQGIISADFDKDISVQFTEDTVSIINHSKNYITVAGTTLNQQQLFELDYIHPLSNVKLANTLKGPKKLKIQVIQDSGIMKEINFNQ